MAYIEEQITADIAIIESGYTVDLQSTENIELAKNVQKSSDKLGKFLISIDKEIKGLQDVEIDQDGETI